MAKIGINLSTGSLQQREVIVEIDTQAEASQTIEITEIFLRNNKEYLETSEIEATKAMIRELRSVLMNTNKEIIQARIEKLNEFTKPFAERVRDIRANLATKGKKI